MSVDTIQKNLNPFAEDVYYQMKVMIPDGCDLLEEHDEVASRTFSYGRSSPSNYMYLRISDYNSVSYLLKDHPSFCAQVQSRTLDGWDELQLIESRPELNHHFRDMLGWALSILPETIQKWETRKKYAAELIRDLEFVFPPYGLDGGISLGQALLDDDYESDNMDKMQAAYERDITDNWRNVPPQDLEAYWGGFSVFPYLDNKGWKYYLPAALRQILSNPLSNCEFYTRISLLPGKNISGIHEWNLNKTIDFLELTLEQVRVVSKILVFMTDGDPDWLENHPAESEQLKQWIER